MGEIQNIQWFPGHMAKTKRKIAENIKLVDAVAEIVDARIPESSRNPDFEDLLKTKPRIIVLNKCDMADKYKTKSFIKYYEDLGMKAISTDCKTGNGVNRFAPSINEILNDKIEAYKAKGFLGKTLKIMVVGIPNVGKSSFINKLSKGKKAKVEDRPGVTRGNQWFSIGKNIELLDTPGVLWPKFNDISVGEKLAFTGAVKDDVLDVEKLASNLIEFLVYNYPDSIKSRYKLQDMDIKEKNGYDVLNAIGKKRGMLITGGEVDATRAATMVLDEFRNATLGKFTLDILK